MAFDSVKTRIISDATLRTDFDVCVNLFQDIIALLIPPSNSEKHNWLGSLTSHLRLVLTPVAKSKSKAAVKTILSKCSIQAIVSAVVQQNAGADSGTHSDSGSNEKVALLPPALKKLKHSNHNNSALQCKSTQQLPIVHLSLAVLHVAWFLCSSNCQ